MHIETRLALHRARTADLRAEADASRLAALAKYPRDFRTRLGWALVEAGLRLATPNAPRPTLVP